MLGAQHSKSARLAWRDIRDAIVGWELWRTFAWNDVMTRYRRSRLGQFWITISIGIFILAIGVFYGQILSLPLDEYLRYLAIGYILWGFLVGCIGEGPGVFVGATSFLTQTRIPQTALVLRCLLRNVIVFAHNAVIIFAILLIYPVDPGLSLLLLVPGFALWLLTLFWVIMALGLICVRFRDVAQIVTSVMQIAFFVTPVLYKPDMLTGHARLLAGLNPFTHYISLLRDPLLGGAPAPVSWIVCGSIAIVGGFFTFRLFARLRSRVPYWL